MRLRLKFGCHWLKFNQKINFHRWDDAAAYTLAAAAYTLAAAAYTPAAAAYTLAAAAYTLAAAAYMHQCENNT